MRNLLASFLAVCLSSLVLTDCSKAHSAAPELEIASCKIEGIDVAAECGRLYVFENRKARSGRKIPIEFVRVRATGENPAPDAVFELAGGPGENATQNAAKAIAASKTLQQRDLVIVDQRGTGKSNPLDCVKYDLSARPEAFAEMFEQRFFDVDRFRACKDRLSQVADLRYYTTSLIADDIDDLRAALGYDKMTLEGGSYGTTLALEIIRRHGDHVRAAVLLGVIPPEINQTQTLARDTQDKLEKLFAACEGDGACSTAFPTFRADFQEVLEKVRAEPVNVVLPHALTHEPVEVRVHYSELVTGLRYALYSTRVSAGLPLAVEEAKAGDYRRISQFLPQVLYLIADFGSEGMWASVRCAEEFPYLDVDRARADAEGTMLGTERIDSGEAICSFWPRGAIPDNFHEPVRSDVPVLLLAGEVDAATPPWMGELAVKTLKNGRLVIAANSSHWELPGNDCLDGIVAKFIDTASAADIDASCAAEIKRPPFILQ
ncbi:MAG TPA: alpha/beta hydrolase [Parvularculaceae bacterium]|nr:alpha/beta hydrolase [Parvularculaceae bacterium]